MSRLKIPLFPQICAHRTHPTQKSTPVSFLYSRPTYRVGTWNIPTLQQHHSSSFQHLYSSLHWNFTVLVNYTRDSHFGSPRTCPDWKFHFFLKFVPTTHTPHKNPHMYHSSTVGLHTWLEHETYLHYNSNTHRRFSISIITQVCTEISLFWSIIEEKVISVYRGHVQTENSTFSTNLCKNWDFHGNCYFGTQRTCMSRLKISLFPQICARSKILQEIVISAHCGHVQTENSTFSTNLCLFQDFAGNCHFGPCDMFRLKMSLFPTNLCTSQDFAGNSHFGTLNF